MKLFKILLLIFAIYFIRRFIQLYKVMKKIQQDKMREPENRARQTHSQAPQRPTQPPGQVVDAEYKVMDN